MLERSLEILFGMDNYEVPQGVTKSIGWQHPTWMGSNYVLINVLLVLLAIALSAWIYSRDGRKVGPRIGLGLLRVLLFTWLLVLINRPIIKKQETLVVPSVVAVLIDDSLSMYMRDTGDSAFLAPRGASVGPATGPSSRPADEVEFLGGTGPTRLNVAVGLLTGEDEKLIRGLAAKHALKFYRFSRDATRIGEVPPPESARGDASKLNLNPKLIDAIKGIEPQGGSTQLVSSLMTVLSDLQTEQLDGVVVITDARETPAPATQVQIDRLKQGNAKLFAVLVGSEKPPKNLAITNLSVQDSAFKNDIVTAKATVRATGYEAGKTVKVKLKDKKTGKLLANVDGKAAEVPVTFPDDKPQEIELTFQAKDVGTLQVVAEVDVEEGELNRKDNVSNETVAVLDAKVNVLYVDGYPRWEYRYIKNEMIRDRTVNISCLLTSADPSFRQEGDPPEPDFDGHNPDGSVSYRDPRTGSKFPGPIVRFPETPEELRKWDVILFGDVDPRQFSNRQIKMIADFVENEAGGFGMVAGPQHAPVKYRNTPIDAMLPVTINNVANDDPTALFRDGWRPVVTDEGKRGEAAMIFRFFADKEKNDKYLRDDLQPIFWYCRGVSVKEGVGLVYATHPGASDPTGRPAPVLVLGKFGTGRTLFSAIDDSWRWRYYTGESVFDTFWVQQIRYLARGRKLAERGIKFTVDRERYERGQPITISLTILSPALLKDRRQVKVQVMDENGQLVREVTLTRQEKPDNLFTAKLIADDKFGAYTVKLASLGEGVDPQQHTYHIMVPQLELEKPETDRDALRKLTTEDRIIPAKDAREQLPKLVTGEAKRELRQHDPIPLTSTWRAMIIFMLLLTTEWVLRKVFGML